MDHDPGPAGLKAAGTATATTQAQQGWATSAILGPSTLAARGTGKAEGEGGKGTTSRRGGRSGDAGKAEEGGQGSTACSEGSGSSWSAQEQEAKGTSTGKSAAHHCDPLSEGNSLQSGGIGPHLEGAGRVAAAPWNRAGGGAQQLKLPQVAEGETAEIAQAQKCDQQFLIQPIGGSQLAERKVGLAHTANGGSTPNDGNTDITSRGHVGS